MEIATFLTSLFALISIIIFSISWVLYLDKDCRICEIIAWISFISWAINISAWFILYNMLKC